MASSGFYPKFSSLLARYATAAAFFVSMSSTATALVSSTIYVSSGSFGSPYYSFYENSNLTGLLDISTGGADSLLTSETYTFVKDSTSHPFYVSDQGYNAMSSIFNITNLPSLTAANVSPIFKRIVPSVSPFTNVNSVPAF